MAVISIKNKTKSGSLLVGNTAYNPPIFDSIATTTLSTATASITFSSIPATYKHLQLRTLAQQASTGGYVEIILNNATFNRRHYLYGDGASANAGADTTNAPGIFSSAFSSGNSVFAGSVIDILDYTSTDKNKVTRSLGGVDNNGSGAIYFMSGLYTSSTAITSITLNAISQNFTTNSSFALYGIKG
jgi:hypothetical protein